ncbi:MAG: hypothetical protein HOD54_00405 [Candidatus Magasanikbacteria bacterium]|jgi:hypothetical protein|nr:hypothetical protein [Candidatus Magasanikbacteria bacterium]MBT4314539.1 hypothetical protein [Candidatus Magasanikbacteria bacterium]MBT4547437.1 hypothetical protein [Candidatus Magasanikbacteria bacterium]
MIPKTLRIWFLAHFAIDMIVAIPLMIAPEFVLGLFGFGSVEIVTARLVAAALLAVGGTSLWMHKGSVESFRVMLKLKLLWSGFACLGIIWSIFEGSPNISWFVFVIFMVFFGIWFYYLDRLKKFN